MCWVIAAIKSQGVKTSKLRPDLLVHAGAVEDRSGCRSRARLARPHLFDPKGVADDVLGEPFHVLALAGEHPASAVDVEARVNPASQHPGPLGRQQPLVDQKPDHPCAEEFLQGLETGLGHDVEDPRTRKQPVGASGDAKIVKIGRFEDRYLRRGNTKERLSGFLGLDAVFHAVACAFDKTISAW